MIGQVGKDSQIVVIKEAARVRVPAKSQDMVFCGETQIGSGSGEKAVVIPEHWHNAFPVGGVLVNRNFYGILESDLGKKITATVQVYEKAVGNQKFTALDVFKANGTQPTCKLQILDSESEGAFPIQGTPKFICFR